MNKQATLNDLRPGQRGRVSGILTQGPLRRRLLDLGLIEHTLVECVGYSPGGDPRAFLIRGAVIAIRCEDCRNILIIREWEGKHGAD